MSSLPELLVLRPLAAHVESALDGRFKILRPWEATTTLEKFIDEHAKNVRALLVSALTRVGDQTLGALPSLGLIVTTTSGLDHIDLKACARRGIQVAYAGEVFSDEVADYAVGMLIAVLRRLSAADRYVRSGRWPVDRNFPLGSKVSGKRVGIVGLGSIGSRTAKRLEPFGCFISYTSRTKKTSVHYTYYSNVVELATESDVLVITCALNSGTHHLINKDVMEALGKDGIIINVARGAIIDEKELVKQLTEGSIGGAGLDVFENEPHVPKELFSMDNVVLSSHAAVFSLENLSNLQKLIIDNLEAFFSNRPLLTPVPEFS